MTDDEGLRNVNRRRAANGERRLHRCDACGYVDVWGDTWEWYGSEADIDDGKPIAKVCGRADCVPGAHVKALYAAKRRQAREESRR